jgi:hypothetical protein
MSPASQHSKTPAIKGLLARSSPWGKAVVFGLALSASAASANVCPPVEPGIQAAYQDFSRLQSAVRSARESLDISQFHPASLQAELGREPETLLAWVRDNTRWLDHEGSLRGPSGVLMDGMGSSLDRSLLLVTLLEAAGHRAQLASTPLDEGHLERLRSAWTGEQSAIQPIGNVPAAEIRARAEAFGFDARELGQELEQRTRVWHEVRELLAEQTRRQASALDAALNGQTPSAHSSERLHWWVQVDERGGWRDLDPALPGLAAGQTLAGPATKVMLVDDIDPGQFHRLSLRIVAEQWEPGGLREHTALEHEIRSSALIRNQLSIDLVPTALPDLDQLLAAVPTELPQQVSQADEWLPVLHIGDAPMSDQLIMSDGSVRPVDSGPAHGRALREATSVLGSLSIGGLQYEQPAASPELAAVRVVFQIDAPGQERIEIRRELMDMIGPAARARNSVAIDWDDTLRQKRAVAMLGGLKVQGQAAWLNEEFVAWQRYGALVDNRLAGLAALDAQAHDRLELMGSALLSRSTLNDELLALAQMRQLFSPEQTRIGLTGLNLLGWARMLALDGQVPSTREGFDILHNPVAVLAGDARQAAQTRLNQGVFETALEAWILDSQGELIGGNTSRRFQQDLNDQIEWVWLRNPADLPKLQNALPDDIHQHLADVLAAGRVVVVPDQALSLQAPSWWEIDPISGTTLGYGPERRGQFVEAILMLMKATDNATAAVGMVHSIWGCLFNHASAPGMQCCIRNTAMKEALNRYISNGLSEYAKVAGLTFVAGKGVADMLNTMLIGKLAGAAAGAVTNPLDPSLNCPQ